jgi:predicted secreted protein
VKTFREGDKVVIRRGEAFEILLREPGASGYLFALSAFDSEIIRKMDERHGLSTDGGAQGVATFRFKALSPGAISLTFALVAPWGEAAEKRQVEVIVH